MNQVSVSAVNFQVIESGSIRALGRPDEIALNFADFLDGQFVRDDPALVPRQRRGANNFGRPAALGFRDEEFAAQVDEGRDGRGFAAGVRELDARDGLLAVNGRDDSHLGLDLLVLPKVDSG